MRDRYHTTSIGPDEEALRAGFIKCGEFMEARGCAVMGLSLKWEGAQCAGKAPKNSYSFV